MAKAPSGEDGSQGDLRKRSRELTELRGILENLAWDQEVVMPAKGSAIRASQMSTLAAIHHQRLTDPALGDLIAEAGEPADPWEEANLREMRRDFERATRLPESLVRELTETRALAYQAWVHSREAADFAAFAPWLEKIVRLKRQESRCLADNGNPYDPLLDEFEPGMKSSRLDSLFSEIRPVLTNLLERIQEKRPKPMKIEGDFARENQERLGRAVLSAMGFDFDAGRLDVSPHPFCTGLSPADVRITTRYSATDFTSSLFGIIHEGGHALYEHGLGTSRYGQPVCQAVSLGVHESQSRLWENVIGRGAPFWNCWYPRLGEFFQGLPDRYCEEDVLRAVNRVEASLIRVDADEVTYGLHVILRYEIEVALMSEELQVSDLEETWNEKMEEYLGIRPSDSGQGVLQDTHWSQGLIGYFPTYLLGNLYASHFYQKASDDLGDLDQMIRSGEMKPLREWLIENVHSKGRLRSAEQLVEDVSGSELSVQPFLDYLEEKFGELYRL